MAAEKPNGRSNASPVAATALAALAAARFMRGAYFDDPISLERTRKRDGVLLNRQWYARSSLRNMVRHGDARVPHSRRQMTNAELEAVGVERPAGSRTPTQEELQEDREYAARFEAAHRQAAERERLARAAGLPSPRALSILAATRSDLDRVRRELARAARPTAIQVAAVLNAEREHERAVRAANRSIARPPARPLARRRRRRSPDGRDGLDMGIYDTPVRLLEAIRLADAARRRVRTPGLPTGPRPSPRPSPSPRANRVGGRNLGGARRRPDPFRSVANRRSAPARSAITTA